MPSEHPHPRDWRMPLAEWRRPVLSAPCRWLIDCYQYQAICANASLKAAVMTCVSSGLYVARTLQNIETTYDMLFANDGGLN